jgi:L-fuculose-phosphate aldolase
MNRNEFQLRKQIVQVGRLMYDKDLIVSNDGNISARLSPGRLLITPSGLHKGFLEPGDILMIDEDGQRIGPGSIGNRKLKPTSELPLHLEAYRQRPDIDAVVHAHPPITIALSIAGIPMAACLIPEVIVSLGLIPTTEYATPSSRESIRAIRDLISNHDALVLQRHGSVTVGNTPMQAFMRLETVEQNARIAFMLSQLGVVNQLPAEEVAKLLKQREALGLVKEGEATEFCVVCGVCHLGGDHAPTMRLRKGHSEVTAEGNRTGNSTFQQLPTLQQLSVDEATIRDLVAQVVQKTLKE